VNALIAPPTSAPPEAALDVRHELKLHRCRCSGTPKRFKMDQGYYIICGFLCNRPGSGVYPRPEQAEAAWNRLQETGA